MSWIIGNMRWIMIASGTLTATMVYAAFSPEAALQSTFGETLTGPLANIVVRTWGALIALVGAMLIYGGVDPTVRPLVLTVASVSKAFFIGLVLSEGSRYLGSAGIAVVLDSVMIVLFLCYLLAGRAAPSEPSQASARIGV